MKPRTYHFDGEELRMSEIRRRVPTVPRITILGHLAAGRNTTASVLAYRRLQPKPKPRSHIFIGSRLPYCMGGPAPTAPRRIR